MALAIVLVMLLVGAHGSRPSRDSANRGYGRPTLELAWRRVWNTLYGVFRLVPADRHWQGVASWFSATLPVIALSAWRWISPAHDTTWRVAAIAVIFALPFLFAAKAEQVYMIGLGNGRDPFRRFGCAIGSCGPDVRRGAHALSSSSFSRWGSHRLRSWRAILHATSNRSGPIVLAHDNIVRTWTSVPTEVRETSGQQARAGRVDPVSSNPSTR